MKQYTRVKCLNILFSITIVIKNFPIIEIDYNNI